MIIEKSLDRYLLSIVFAEYNTREIVRSVERLSQVEDGVLLMPHLLTSLNSLALYKSGSLHYNMHHRVYKNNSYFLSLFSIDFVYNFFKSIVASCPAGQVDAKLLLTIFKDSYAAYAQEVGMDKLKLDMPMLDEKEIQYIGILVDSFLSNRLDDISRGFRNDIIN